MIYNEYEPKLKELFKQIDEAAKVLKVAEAKKKELEEKLEHLQFEQAREDFEKLKSGDVVNLPTYKICRRVLEDGKTAFDKIKIELLSIIQQIDRVKAAIVTLKSNYEALIEAQKKSLNNILKFKNGKRRSKRPD